MLTMGVPLGAIEMKMMAEDVELAARRRFLTVADATGTNVLQGAPHTQSAKRPNSRMLPTLKLHWNTIAGNRIEIWVTIRR